MLDSLEKMLEKTRQKRLEDEETFKNLDEALCVICHAYGQDKRSLRIDCMYAVNEVVPEMLDLTQLEGQKAYYARICKACRGNLLGKLKEWADERRYMRSTPKDHDGNVEETDPARNIPVRVNGAIVMMNEEEYGKYRDSKGA